MSADSKKPPRSPDAFEISKKYSRVLFSMGRLEEIMRRTRRTDSPDMNSASPTTLPNENTEPPHNGRIEDPNKTPSGTKSTQLGLGKEDDVVPVVAFKERRSLRALSGLEEIQTKQRAEVI